MSNDANLSEHILHLKKKILIATQEDLTANAFEVPGSNTAIISALAELLIFFSIGDAEYRANKLSDEERQWWRDFCQSLAHSAD